MSNSNKGASSLASVIQRRMAQVSQKGSGHGVSVEFGEIVQGNKLKIYSIPGAILDRGDYSICEGVMVRDKLKCKCEESSVRDEDFSLKTGDKVLIVWTFDGEPVVIDKVI